MKEDRSTVEVHREVYDPGPHAAEVGGSVGFTVSENYRSIRVEAFCRLPSRPDRAEALARTDQAFEHAYTALNRQLDNLAMIAQAVGIRSGVVPSMIPGGDNADKV